MSDQSQPLGAIVIPQLSKIDLTWPDLSIYIIQPALANKPDIEEIPNYPIGAGADKFEIVLQTLHDFPFTGRVFRLQHHSMLIQDRHTLFDIWCVHDVIYAVDPNDDESPLHIYRESNSSRSRDVSSSILPLFCQSIVFILSDGQPTYLSFRFQ